MEKLLWDACANNLLEEAEGILTNNPTVNINWKNANEHDYTCLQIACEYGRSSIVPLLLAHPDINVNQKNNWGGTPLLLACVEGHTRVVRLMLKDARVLINEPSNSGYTPLSIAAYYGRLEVIKGMIASGRELDLGQEGMTSDAIGIAKQQKKTEVASLLESFKVNPAQTRYQVRLELGCFDQLAAEHFALVVFFCDDLLRVNHWNLATPNAKRFLSIVQRLPMEMQMIICYKAAGFLKEIIPSSERELAFRNLARTYV
jgi:hypothetical protein